MRTTVDLPQSVHDRASQLARERGVSLSAVVSDLTMRGLASLTGPVTISTDPYTGLPVITTGRSITVSEVADALDDE